MHQTHLFCFFASYAVAFVLELSRLWQAKRWQYLMATFCTLAGLVAQTWYLLGRSSQSQLPPLLSSSHDWLLVSSWLLVAAYLFYLLMVRKREGYSSLGLFVVPVALGLVSSAAFLDDAPHQAAQSARFWIMLHASSLSIGITGVFIGLMISLMYLLQHKRLKMKRQLRPGFSLPPLAALAKYNYWAVMVSFCDADHRLEFLVCVMAISRQPGKSTFSWKDPVVFGFCIVWGGNVCFVWLVIQKKNRTRTPSCDVDCSRLWLFNYYADWAASACQCDRNSIA